MGEKKSTGTLVARRFVACERVSTKRQGTSGLGLEAQRKAIDDFAAVALREIAAEMNSRGILTRRGGRWHVATVMNLLKRLDVRDS